MRPIHVLAVASLVVAWATVGSTAASAAAPANDTFGGSSALTLGKQISQNTAEAGTDSDDAALNQECGAPATDASVWFDYTPTQDAWVVVDVSGSDYSAGIMVAVGAPGGWSLVGCGSPAVAWPAEVGTTYSIVVFDDQQDGGGNGGTLQLALELAPPQPTIDLKVNPTGSFDARTGVARISGTATCTAAEGDIIEFAEVELQLTQRVGRLKINGYSGTDLACDGTPRPWTVDVTSETGLFKGGKTASATWFHACGEFNCGEGFVEQTVQLKGVKR